MRQPSFLLAAAFGIVVGCCAPALAQAVHFVNAAATGDSTGANWADAFTDLHDALAVPQPGDEIWIAAGTYKPDRGTMNRDLRFIVPGGVSLYGGFAGWESSLEQRVLGSFETIISGDLASDDGSTPCSELSNCCVRRREESGCDDVQCQSLVCGLQPTCCDPKYDGWSPSCVELAHSYCCELAGRNLCENSRRLVEVMSGSENITVLEDITITGAYNRDSLPPTRFAGVTIPDGVLSLNRCQFNNNVYAIHGGQAQLEVIQSAFYQNSGIAILSGGTLTISDSLFSENSVAILLSGDTTVDSCVFRGQRSRTFDVTGHLSMTDTIISENESSSRHYGTAVYTRLVYENNGHGIFEDGTATYRDCVFRGNHVNGGLSVGMATVKLVNCLMVGNHRYVIFSGGNVIIENCVLAYNNWDYAIYADIFSNVLIDNSILWRNGLQGDGDVQGGYMGTIAIHNSILDGWSDDFTGTGNVFFDPLFLDPYGADEIAGTWDDDYRLSPDSPAINAGLITSSTPEVDLDGHQRILCGGLDIGAYEFGIGDPDCDGTVDLLDYQLWPACMTGPDEPHPHPDCIHFDYNADGHIDTADFAAFANSLTVPAK